MSKENNCVLSMKDLRFVSYDYKLYNKPNERKEIKVEHSVKYTTRNNEVEVEMQTKVHCDDFMSLDVCTVGDFEINEEVFNAKPDKESIIDFVIKNNTVAIMFPYIRAQVSLLTSQPGFASINLQPIDVTQMIAEAEIITK